MGVVAGQDVQTLSSILVWQRGQGVLGDAYLSIGCVGSGVSSSIPHYVWMVRSGSMMKEVMYGSEKGDDGGGGLEGKAKGRDLQAGKLNTCGRIGQAGNTTPLTILNLL